VKGFLLFVLLSLIGGTVVLAEGVDGFELGERTEAHGDGPLLVISLEIHSLGLPRICVGEERQLGSWALRALS
jgi:hypothetical protein